MRTCNKINVPLKTDIMFKMIKLDIETFVKFTAVEGIVFKILIYIFGGKIKRDKVSEIKLAALSCLLMP